jgi:hypothetical protein
MACAVALPARAQQQDQGEAQPPPAAGAPQQETAGEAQRVRVRPLSSILASMSRSSGVSVVADSPLTNQNVSAPTAEVTAENLEQQLTALTKALPSGTLWAKLYLPATATRASNGDALANYVLAQAKLFGNVGAPTAPGTIEVMGQKVSADKADAVVSALNLKPVYIVLNPLQRNNPANTTTAAANGVNWAAMTPQQKQAYAQQQAQNIMNMDPQSRQQTMQSMMEQQRAVMGALMQSMTPEQRQQLIQSMRPNGPGGRRPGAPNGTAPPF